VLAAIPINSAEKNDATYAAKAERAYSQYISIIDELAIKDAPRIAPHLPVMPEAYGGAYLDEVGCLNILNYTRRCFEWKCAFSTCKLAKHQNTQRQPVV